MRSQKTERATRAMHRGIFRRQRLSPNSTGRIPMVAHEADNVDERRRGQPEKTRDFDTDELNPHAHWLAVAGASTTMAPVPTLDWPLSLFLDADAKMAGEVLGNHFVLLVFEVTDHSAI